MDQETAYCSEHGFIEEYEPDEYGLNYYQAIGECECGKPTYKENGELTKEVYLIIPTEKGESK